MSNLFRDKYKIESTRLKHWDYSSNGPYYVTICTKGRECTLGNVVNGKIKLSKIGQVIELYWQAIPKHFGNAILDEFVIMPDHIHGIIFLDDSICSVETCHGMSLRKKQFKFNRFSRPVHNSLSMIINHFKSAVTRWCNKNNVEYFQWQGRFYEQIIRSEKRLNAIRKYIINNPIEWELGENNSLH